MLIVQIITKSRIMIEKKLKKMSKNGLFLVSKQSKFDYLKK